VNGKKVPKPEPTVQEPSVAPGKVLSVEDDALEKLDF
jgi:hypothetical protein